MIKIMISLLAILFTFAVWGEENSYLEGISVLGEKKIAYISLEGDQITVSEGDEITLGKGNVKVIWQVIDIKQDSVLFKAKNGSEVELRLDSRLPLPPKMTPELSEQEELPTLEPLEEAQTDLEAAQIDSEIDQANNEMNQAGSDQINLDYQTVQTPFGEMTVKDNEPITQVDSPTKSTPITDNKTPTPTKEEAEVPSGHRLIKTPFGNFVVEGQK